MHSLISILNENSPGESLYEIAHGLVLIFLLLHEICII